jgi:hypothetical protein
MIDDNMSSNNILRLIISDNKEIELDHRITNMLNLSKFKIGK